MAIDKKINRCENKNIYMACIQCTIDVLYFIGYKA